MGLRSRVQAAWEEDERVHIFLRQDGTTIEALESINTESGCPIWVWICAQCGDVGPVDPRGGPIRCGSCRQRYYEPLAVGQQVEVDAFEAFPEFEALPNYETAWGMDPG